MLKLSTQFIACLRYCLFITLLAGLAVPAQTTAGLESGKPMMIDPLIERAIEQGKVRVIVGLRVPSAGEAIAEAGTGEPLRKAAIEKAQDRLLDRMLGYDLGSPRRFSYIPFVAMNVNAAALQQLAYLPEVSSIEEDVFLRPALKESVPLIGAPTAWSYGYTGAGQTIAIVDSGVDKYTPFISGKVVKEGCFSTSLPELGVHSLCPSEFLSSNVPNSGLDCDLAGEGCFHGTHVAGIAAGRGRGISGVAPDASLIAIQVFSRIDSEEICNGARSCILSATSDVLQGLEYVYSLRKTYSIAAVNLSLGGTEFFDKPCDKKYPSHTQAVDLLKAAGIASIAASGNDGSKDMIPMPACISGAISVGATTDGSGGTVADQVAEFSNSAPFLSLLAPGEWITSSVPGGAMIAEHGTSMAAPHVAGAWAVLKSKSPAAGVDAILSVLRSTGKPIVDPGNGLKTPRIQLDAAVDALPSPSNASIAASPSTCVIPAGEEYCALQLTATNPLSAPLQIWIQRPNAPARLVLGTFTDRVFSFVWSWVELGQSVFYLYDVSGSPRRLIAHTEASAVLSPPALRAQPSFCRTDPVLGTCSVTVTIFNPPGQPVQLRVRDKTGIEKEVTGTITDSIYTVEIPWIQPGIYIFTLYDVSGTAPRAIDRYVITGYEQ